jgi:hypothetical protein
MSRATLVASSSPWPGIAGFVVATCILTWSSAIVADRVWDVVRESFPTRLLGASFYYFLTMAWPPVLAVVVVRRWIEPPGHLDLGLRRAGRGALLLGGLAAAAVAAAAMLIAWLVQRLDVVAAGTVTSPEPNLPYQFSLHTLVLLGVAFVGTTCTAPGFLDTERGLNCDRCALASVPWCREITISGNTQIAAPLLKSSL